MRDPERAQRRLELLGRAAVPVDRVLELIRVEVERAREVVLLVLLGNPEVDVEEQESARRRGLRPAAREELREPFGMDEPLVVRQALDGKACVGRPLGPAVLVDADICVPQVGQPAPERRDVLGVVAGEDDLAAGDDVLLVQ